MQFYIVLKRPHINQFVVFSWVQQIMCVHGAPCASMKSFIEHKMFQLLFFFSITYQHYIISFFLSFFFICIRLEVYSRFVECIVKHHNIIIPL